MVGVKFAGLWLGLSLQVRVRFAGLWLGLGLSLQG